MRSSTGPVGRTEPRKEGERANGGETASPAAHPLDADALYRAHARSLYAFIFSKVGNRETAEDITGDVFMKALAHLDPTREEHSIVAWLYRVARNAVNDYWRAGTMRRL